MFRVRIHCGMYGVTLCDDCMEEDMTDEEGSSNKGAFLMTTCHGECELRICAGCFEEADLCHL